MFPGAQAKPSKPGRFFEMPDTDGLEAPNSEEARSGEFTPALNSDESAILDNSVEFMQRVAALEGEERDSLSDEEMNASPEPQLDWEELEERQLAHEDDQATMSSSSLSALDELSTEADGHESAHESPTADSDEALAAANSRRSKSASSDSREKSSSSSSSSSSTSSLSDSSSFPGAVARPSADPEPQLLPAEAVLSPWYRRFPTWKQLAGTSTLSIVLALAVLVLCLPYFRVSTAEEESSLGMFSEVLSSVFSQGSSERVFQGKDRLNILCLGIDYNRDEKGMGYTAGARSDTIFVISVNPEGNILNVLSIPRDIQVYLGDAYGYDKINSAYSVGGIELAKEVISNFLQIPIHKYIIIKVAGAAKMVDAVGGLQIDVEKDMDYDDNWGQLHIHLRAGNQLLHGEQAVGYARFRMDEESDRGRIRRQQQTMQALVQRLKDPMVILRLQSIIKAIKENVITDLSVMDMLDLAYLYKDFDRQQMRTGTLVGDDAEVNGVSVIIPYEPENHKIIAELFSNINTIGRQDVRIEVLNGSGNEKLANAVAEALKQEGFQVSQAAADRSDYQVTRVIDHLGSISMRSAIENVLRGCQYETYEISDDKRGFDITVIVGQDRANIYERSERLPEDTSIYIDNGKASSGGYVDYGSGLTNENTAMPFDDIEVPRSAPAENSSAGTGGSADAVPAEAAAPAAPALPSAPVKAKPEPAVPTAPPVSAPSEGADTQTVPAVSPPHVENIPQEEPISEPDVQPPPESEPAPAPPAPPAPETVPAFEPEPAAPAAEPVPDQPAAGDEAVLPDPVSL